MANGALRLSTPKHNGKYGTQYGPDWNTENRGRSWTVLVKV